MLLSLDYLTSLFYYIPKAALAAVIIMAVVPLFDTKIFGMLWRVKSAYVPLPVGMCPAEGAVARSLGLLRASLNPLQAAQPIRGLGAALKFRCPKALNKAAKRVGRWSPEDQVPLCRDPGGDQRGFSA